MKDTNVGTCRKKRCRREGIKRWKGESKTDRRKRGRREGKLCRTLTLMLFPSAPGTSPAPPNVRIQRVWLIDSYTDDAMDGRLLPSCLQEHVAASIHHVTLSLLHGEKAKVS